MTTSEAAAARDRLLTGLGLMITAMLVVPSLDAFAKLLGRHMPTLEIAFARFFVQALIIGGFALVARRVVDLWPPRMAIQIWRGVALAGTTTFFFAGLKVMPLADTLAITFIEPVIRTGLCASLWKEKVLPRRWVACGIGLVGALVIVRPSLAVFGLNALLPLCAALCFSAYHMMNRALAGTSNVMGAQFITGLAGAALLGPLLVVTSWFDLAGQVAIWPRLDDLPLLAGVGIVSVVTHSLALMAYERVPTVVLAPFGYLEIVSATWLGYVVFGEFPGWPTWIGIGLIVGSGLYTIIREHDDVRPIEPGA